MSKYLFVFFSTIIFSVNAFSQGTSATEFEIGERSGLLPSVKLGANLFSKASLEGVPADVNSLILPQNVVQFSCGFGADYFFGKNLGIFTFVDYNQRTYSFLGLIKASASYLDVPFGFSLNWGRLLDLYTSRTTSRVGGYLALPMTDFEFDQQSSMLLFGRDKINTPLIIARTYPGVYLETETLFAVSRNLSPGLSIWGKMPLASSTQNVDSYFYEMGLGLKVGFF